MSNEDIERLKKKSKSGNIGRRKEHSMRITREQYLRNLTKYIGITTLAVSLSIGGGRMLAKKLNDTLTVNSTKYEYYDGLVNGHKENNYEDRNWREPNPDNMEMGPQISEGGIAYDLMGLNPDDKYGYEFDVGVASLIDCDPDLNIDGILYFTDYGNLDNYLEQKGYDSVKDLQKDINKQIVVKQEIDEKQKELNDMRDTDRVVESTEVTKAGEK